MYGWRIEVATALRARNGAESCAIHATVRSFGRDKRESTRRGSSPFVVCSSPDCWDDVDNLQSQKSELPGLTQNPWAGNRQAAPAAHHG